MPVSAETAYKFTLSASNVGKHTATLTITLLDNYPDGGEIGMVPIYNSVVGMLNYGTPFVLTIPTSSVSGDTMTHQMASLVSGSWYYIASTRSDRYYPSMSGAPNVDTFSELAFVSAIIPYITPAPVYEFDYVIAFRDVRTARVIYHGATSNWSVEADYFPAGTTDTLTLVDHGTAADLEDIGITVAASPVDGTTTIDLNPSFAVFQTEVDNTPKVATVTQWEQLASVISNGNGIAY